MRFSGQWISEESFISNGFVLFYSGNQTELLMKEIFLECDLCSTFLETTFERVKRKHRRQGESAMRSEQANINMQIIHSRAICR